jgi:hypothetical protein
MKKLDGLDALFDKFNENIPTKLWLATMFFSVVALGGLFGFICTHRIWLFAAAIAAIPIATILNEICNLAAFIKTAEELDDGHHQ